MENSAARVKPAPTQYISIDSSRAKYFRDPAFINSYFELQPPVELGYNTDTLECLSTTFKVVTGVLCSCALTLQYKLLGAGTTTTVSLTPTNVVNVSDMVTALNTISAGIATWVLNTLTVRGRVLSYLTVTNITGQEIAILGKCDFLRYGWACHGYLGDSRENGIPEDILIDIGGAFSFPFGDFAPAYYYSIVTPDLELSSAICSSNHPPGTLAIIVPDINNDTSNAATYTQAAVLDNKAVRSEAVVQVVQIICGCGSGRTVEALQPPYFHHYMVARNK